MKKLSVLVALIMAITIFWIPGQSVFATEEEGTDEGTVQALDEPSSTNPTDPTSTEPTEPTTEPTESTTEPVTPTFTCNITPGLTSVKFDWFWTNGNGIVSIRLYRPTISDRNSTYRYDSGTYRYDSGTVTNGMNFSNLEDGTTYNYTIKATVDGKTVYEKTDGQVTTVAKKANGWLTVGNDKYYYQSGVKVRCGTVKLRADGCNLNHYFDCNGVFVGRRDYMYSRIKGLSSKAYLICVDRTNNVVCVYKGGKNKWRPFKYWSCVTGRMKRGDYHPTPLGVFKVKSKKKTFSGYGKPEQKKNRYSVWHCTRFVGSVFFHSQLYKYKSTKSFIPGGRAMGVNASHGCVRLHKSNAYWLYKNIAKGTTVVVIQ